MVHFKLTEKSYRKEFIEKLSTMLEPKGMVLFDDPSLSYIDKENNKRKTHFPDIVIVIKDKVVRDGDIISLGSEGVVAVIETKKASKGVYDGFNQAISYMNSLNANQTFATNFKDVVAFQLVDNRPKIDERLNSKLDEKTINSTIDFIVSVITKTTELHPVELNDDLIVKILEGAVFDILEYIKKIESKELEEPLGFFFAKKLDSEIVSSSKNKKEFDLAIKKGTAYLIINQILFYHILSTEATSKYKKLIEINNIGELQGYFDRVLEDDYKSIFGAKIAKFLPSESIDAINSIIKAVNILGLQRIKHDILGKIFHGLIPQELRKRIAAYYTSNAAAQLLAELCIENKDVKVLDPACGSGTLLVASYQKKRDLYLHNSEEIHKKLLTQIIGGDISIFAAHLAAIHLALQEPLSFTDEIHIILGDFFSLSPKKTVLDWINQSKIVKKVSAEDIRDAEFSVPLVDLIIMNPPFTRMELLDNNYKRFIENSFELSNNKKYFQGRMGLHALFLLHADDFLKQDGKIAAVLPASTFYTSYGEQLSNFFLANYNIDYLITSDVETAFSEQATFKEILFVATKNKGKSKAKKTLFISLKKPLTLKNTKELSHQIKKLDEEAYEDNLLRVRAVTQKELAQEKNWMIFTEESTKTYKKLLQSKNIVIAEDFIKENIAEGIRRFPINFFFLPNKLWNITEEKDKSIIIKHKNTSERLLISKKLLISALRKPDEYSTIGLEPKHYILTIHPNERLDKDLQRYILLAEKMGMDKESSTLLKSIKKENIPWYSYTYLLRRNPKIFGNLFIIYKLRLNTAKIMAHYTKDNITGGGMFLILSGNSEEDAKILTLWYNSIAHIFLFLLRGRAIQGSFYEAFISDIKKFPMLNIKELDNFTRKELLLIFDKYTKREMPSIPRQIELGVRNELDLAILRALKIENPDKVLKELYSYVHDKIEKLRTESIK